MASRKSIEGPPAAIVQLDVPFDRDHGRIQGSVVHRLHGSKKRKRSELAVGIDTIGIKIYEVQNPRLVASYPISPQTYLLCSPCSTYQKKTKLNSARRHTLAAVSTAPPGTREHETIQIVGFLEESPLGDLPRQEKATFTLEKSTAEVVSIDVIPHTSLDSTARVEHDVIVTLCDGAIVCLDGQLSEILWRWDTPGTSKVEKTVEYSTLVESENAQNGILKGRRDVLALLGLDDDQPSSITSTFMILLTISRRNDPSNGKCTRNVDVFGVLRRSSAGLSSNDTPIRQLLSWPLPASKTSHGDGPAKHSLHASAGHLHTHVDDCILTFDLSGVVPENITTVKTGAPCQSFLRIAQHALLAISSTTCTVYDMKFNAIQDSQQQGIDSITYLQRKEKKQLGSALRKSFQYVSFLPDLNLALAISANEIVSQQITSSRRKRKRPKNDDSLLIDVLGKGTRTQREMRERVHSDHLPKFLKQDGFQESRFKKWAGALAALDEAASRKDVTTFEELFLPLVGVEQIPSSSPRTNGFADRAAINGNSRADPDANSDSEAGTYRHQGTKSASWIFPPSNHKEAHQFRDQALYALGKIFVPVSSQENTTSAGQRALEIQFFPPNVYRWLLIANFISLEVIGQALNRSSHSLMALRAVISQDLISAIVQIDPGLQPLVDLLTLPNYLDISTVVQGMKVFIQSFDSVTEKDETRAIIPAPEMELDEPDHTTNGTGNPAALDETVDSHLALATADISHAESTLEHGPVLLTEGLRHALLRLHSFPSQSIVQSLRRELSTEEIIFLIHVLRIELASGGWTSRYVDAGPESDEWTDQHRPDHVDGVFDFTPADGSIAVVASLINCAVDAIGVGGWLWVASHTPTLAEGGDPTDDPRALLASLKGDVSHALEGIHEVNFIREIAAEFLRYGEKLQRGNAHAAAHPAKQNRKALRQGEMTRPVTVREGAGVEEDVRLALRAALPLGMRNAKEGLARTKVGSGGAIVSKTRRELGMEKSKKVGKYSFERIRI